MAHGWCERKLNTFLDDEKKKSFAPILENIWKNTFLDDANKKEK